MIKPYIPVAEHFIFSAVVLLGGHMHLPPSPKALHETGLWTSTFRSVKMCWWLPLLEGLILRGVSEVQTLKTSRHLSPYSQSEDRFCNQLFLSLPITATAEIGAEGFGVSLCCYEIIGINWIRTFGHVPIQRQWLRQRAGSLLYWILFTALMPACLLHPDMQCTALHCFLCSFNSCSHSSGMQELAPLHRQKQCLKIK